MIAAFTSGKNTHAICFRLFEFMLLYMCMITFNLANIFSVIGLMFSVLRLVMITICNDIRNGMHCEIERCVYSEGDGASMSKTLESLVLNFLGNWKRT